MNWLISYNHSGNGWVRYCIEYLTQLPTHGHQAFSMSERNNNFLNVDLSKLPIVIKRHEINIDELNNDDNLILLIRNPFDAIKEYKNPHIEFEKYYNLIQVYNLFTGNKCIIKYTELFKIETIEYIIKFLKLNINQNKFIEFKNNFNLAKETSKSIHQNKMNEKGTNLELYIDNKILNNILKLV